MGHSVTTIVIESRPLFREALVSLISNHEYQVLGSFTSSASLDNIWQAAEAPALVIIGSLPANEVADAAGGIRKRWPRTKIILLLDRALSTGLQELLEIGIDGCIPLSAPPDMLTRTLHQIIAGDMRILVLESGNSSTECRIGSSEKADMSGSARLEPTSTVATQYHPTIHQSSTQVVHGLSRREEQILRSVVRGHSNKMIARTCGVTDATIKVHMKSILRKIRVENRTQAAIWALERGYGAASVGAPPMLANEPGSAPA